MNDEKKRKGANEESSPFNLRLPHKTRDKLDAVAAQLPILSTHRVAVAALDIGLAALAADPSLILRIGAPAKAVEAAPVPAEPPLVVSPSMPPRRATLPPARASVRPPLPSVPPPPRVPAELVDTEAARVDPRQLALIAEPPIALAEMSVRVMPVSQDELRRRYVTARDEESKHTPKGQRVWTETAIAARIETSPGVVGKFMRGAQVSPESFEKLMRGFDESAETR